MAGSTSQRRIPGLASSCSEFKTSLTTTILRVDPSVRRQADPTRFVTRNRNCVMEEQAFRCKGSEVSDLTTSKVGLAFYQTTRHSVLSTVNSPIIHRVLVISPSAVCQATEVLGTLFVKLPSVVVTLAWGSK